MFYFLFKVCNNAVEVLICEWFPSCTKSGIESVLSSEMKNGKWYATFNPLKKIWMKKSYLSYLRIYILLAMLYRMLHILEVQRESHININMIKHLF